jgi:hypothetical protein
LALPGVVVLAAASVTLCGAPGVSESEAGLAVTPAGNPLRATLTVPVNPLSAVAVSCTGCPVPPAFKLRDEGVTASEKSGSVAGGAVTVMATEAVCVRPPDVPVNVAVDDPADVPRGAARAMVAAVPGVSVTDVGCAVTPVGTPAIVTETLPENPFCAVARREMGAGVPLAGKLIVAGVAVSEKLGVVGAWTVSEACVVADCPFTVVVKVTIVVVAGAEEAAENVSGSVAPGVADNVAGEIVTPAGRPLTEIVAAPAPAGAANKREAGCPVVPAVKLMAEGVSVSEAKDSLLPLPLLLLQEVRPPARSPQAKSESIPLDIWRG